MSRLRLIFAVALLFAALPVMHAQGGFRTANWLADSAPAPRAEPPWKPEDTAKARFPITVSLTQNTPRYDGVNYRGDGMGHVFNPQGENIRLSYRCDLTFATGRSTEFFGRWIVPDRKLEILLEQPGTGRTRTCRVRTVVAQRSVPAGTSTP